MWVDRTGMKVGITEQYSRQSKGTLALVAQASACRASGLLAEWSESQRRRRFSWAGIAQTRWLHPASVATRN